MAQTFGGRTNFHPHVHALVSRGGWTPCEEWILLPYVDEAAAVRLFRHKVLALLRGRGLLSKERIELLLSWRQSGAGVFPAGLCHVLSGGQPYQCGGLVVATCSWSKSSPYRETHRMMVVRYRCSTSQYYGPKSGRRFDEVYGVRTSATPGSSD